MALVGMAYLASRVGNIGARGVRSGEEGLGLTLSDPVLPGVVVAAHWNTRLGSEVGPVVLKARSSRAEAAVGQGEFGVGQAMVMFPCGFGGQDVGVGLYSVGETEELLGQRTVEVLPAGPDCLK